MHRQNPYLPIIYVVKTLPPAPKNGSSPPAAVAMRSSNRSSDRRARGKKSKGATQETWTYVYDEKNELVTVKRSQTDGGAIDRAGGFQV